MSLVSPVMLWSSGDSCSLAVAVSVLGMRTFILEEGARRVRAGKGAPFNSALISAITG